jgi:hypothetical protein
MAEKGDLFAMTFRESHTFWPVVSKALDNAIKQIFLAEELPFASKFVFSFS